VARTHVNERRAVVGVTQVRERADSRGEAAGEWRLVVLVALPVLDAQERPGLVFIEPTSPTGFLVVVFLSSSACRSFSRYATKFTELESG
jgi:hypothetical protein